MLPPPHPPTRRLPPATQATGDQSYLEYATALADNVVDRATTDDRGGAGGTALCWHHAEHRAQPRHIAAYTGLMQGAAGVALFLVHLAQALDGCPSSVFLPDVPTPAWRRVAVTSRL